MRRIMLIGGAAAAVIAAGCADSSTRYIDRAPAWSGAVIQVAAADPNARGQLRGIVVDSTTGVDPTAATPIPGTTVVLNLKVLLPPATSSDTATTTVRVIGQVVTDAKGRFLVTAIPVGDYYLVATPPANTQLYSNTTWAFASSGATASDAVIYLPRKLGVAVDSSSWGPDDPPITTPIESM